MSKPPRLGCINPCGCAVLFDAKGLPVVACHDTPNAVQVAFEDYPQAVKAQADFNGGTRAERTGRCLGDDQRASLRRAKSGRVAVCNACRAAKERRRRVEDAEAISQRRRAAYDPDKAKEVNRARYEKNRERYIADAKAARHTDKGRARAKLQLAVQRGKIAKPDACELCERTGVRISGHHEDYSRPLEVQWVCDACHAQIHIDKDRDETASHEELLGGDTGQETRRYPPNNDDPTRS